MDMQINQDWIDNSAGGWLEFARKIAVLKTDNPDNIAKMLEAFSLGCAHVLAGITEITYSPPPLVVDMSEDPRVAMAGHEWDKRNDTVTERIVLSGRHLQFQSQFSLDEDLDIRHDYGILNYSGSRINRYILAGVEEMDHVHYQRSNGYIPFPKSNRLDRQDVYDANPMEFRSLHTRLRIAIELGMDQRTIEMIRDRIDAASRIHKIQSVRQS